MLLLLRHALLPRCFDFFGAWLSNEPESFVENSSGSELEKEVKQQLNACQQQKSNTKTEGEQQNNENVTFGWLNSSQNIETCVPFQGSLSECWSQHSRECSLPRVAFTVVPCACCHLDCCALFVQSYRISKLQPPRGLLFFFFLFGTHPYALRQFAYAKCRTSLSLLRSQLIGGNVTTKNVNFFRFFFFLKIDP